MSDSRSSLVEQLKTIVAVAQRTQITFLAASIAYYAFVSLVPSLLLAFIVASTIGGDAFANSLLSATQGVLTPAGQETIVTALESTAGRGGVTIVGVVLLVWGTLKVFRALDTAFLMVYGQTQSASILDQFRDAIIVLASIGIGVLSMIIVGVAITTVPLGGFSRLVGVLALPGVLFVVFLPLYRQFPNPPISTRAAVPGAIVAAIGWTLLQAGFQLYAVNAAQYQLYGVLGGILLLVTWLYLAATLVMIGAVVNAVLGGSVGMDASDVIGPAGETDRQLQQGPQRGTGYMGRERTDRESTTDIGADEESSDKRESVSPSGAPDIADLDEQLAELRADLDAFEDDVTDRTVEKPALEAELKRYVRRRMRRGHARGWGPYLVLLYGTALTLGAFYFFSSDLLAIVAMLIIFLSTLGLYVLFVLFGVGLNLAGGPRRIIEFVRDRRN